MRKFDQRLTGLGGPARDRRPSLAQTTLTIGTVNNGDMIRMQGLTSEFAAKNPESSSNG